MFPLLVDMLIFITYLYIMSENPGGGTQRLKIPKVRELYSCCILEPLPTKEITFAMIVHLIYLLPFLLGLDPVNRKIYILDTIMRLCFISSSLIYSKFSES